MFLTCIGNISSWKLIATKNSCIFHINHSFQKQSFLSQYQIVGPNGIIKCSIPTQKKSRKGLYKDVFIDYSENWQDEQWKRIENAYIKAPFFQFYNYKIEPVFKKKFTNLIDFNFEINRILIDCVRLNIATNSDEKTAAYYTDSPPVNVPKYPQVYDLKIGFQNDLSILDLLFNLGPETSDYLKSDMSS